MSFAIPGSSIRSSCEMKETAAEAALIAAAKWHRKKQRLMVQVRGSVAIEIAQQVRKTNKSSAVAWQRLKEAATSAAERNYKRLWQMQRQANVEATKAASAKQKPKEEAIEQAATAAAGAAIKKLAEAEGSSYSKCRKETQEKPNAADSLPYAEKKAALAQEARQALTNKDALLNTHTLT